MRLDRYYDALSGLDHHMGVSVGRNPTLAYNIPSGLEVSFSPEGTKSNKGGSIPSAKTSPERTIYDKGGGVPSAIKSPERAK